MQKTFTTSRALEENTHPARRLAIPLLYAIFIIMAILATVSTFLPLWLHSRTTNSAPVLPLPIVLYFANIGLGYMLVEVSLIHRLTVFLGNPTYSFTVVLSSLLLSSGVGSLVVERWQENDVEKKIRTIIATLGLILLLYGTFSNKLFLECMLFPMSARIIISIVTISVPGILMGMCFPLGIRFIRKFSPQAVAWAWGINCGFSVLGSIFALILALHVGLAVTLLAGTFLYVVCGLVFFRATGGHSAPVKRRLNLET